MSTHVVDYSKVLEAVKDKCAAGDLSLRKAAAQCGVPSGVFSRMKSGLHCSDDNFASIMVWLGVARELMPFLKEQVPIVQGKPVDSKE